MVVAGAVDPAPLRAAGWSLRGALSRDPYDAPHGAGLYADADDVLADPQVDAVALDGGDAGLAGLLPELRAGGLLVLLPTAAPLDPDLVRAARAVAEPAEAAVGLLGRWEPWALTVAAALPLVGSLPVQVTVRGWPRGRSAAAELVDLVAAWCGEVVGAVAAPAPLPAEVLPGGASVAWALLTASGATVLVSHDGGPPEVRLSFPTARLEAGPAGARWTGGADLPLLPLPPGVPPAHGSPPGLVATAAALAAAVGGGDIPTDRWPWPADLGDLLVVARVLEALRTSARTEQLVAVA
ncbi:MAG: hypothetical protein AVDCRST_MAG16-1959 [uncultured Frankineae bacterium]|uniref:Gfo/Idh/MocA-like oxidoreductase N-terminal domain-containing protein n=1 Tax=uncultured Frankineae bacterium TaxID=437475 RepID=A0A6J4LXU2_9ACTN|nr:MAG: hypothetical protein AVDCRST_MAG16-1959 [uncultured Frankineae bacterium]